MRKKFFALGLLLTMLVTTGAACSGTTSTVPTEKTKKITLQYWGVFTDSDQMDILIKKFQEKHPNIVVEYRKFRPEEYEQKLVEAFAQDKGPDIFTIHNTWLNKYRPYVQAMPATISYAVFTQTGGAVGSKTEITLATKPALTLKQLKEQFVSVVERDVTALAATTSTQPSIFALPFFVDTLGMYYNNDLLGQNAIVKPAEDWATLMGQVSKLRRLDADGLTVTQVAATMGTGANTHRASDLMAVLMLQNGATMITADGSVAFNRRPTNTPQDEETPGARALHFYTDFANPQKNVYTWSAEQGDALEAFVQGRVAYYFGYSYDLATIKGRNPRLNVEIASLPQITPGKPVNVANYWMETVSKKSQTSSEAWLFVLETATNKDALKPFLESSGRVAALKDLVQTQLEDLQVGVFAKQSLTAQTWYRGQDSAAADQIMVEMIDDTLTALRTKPEDKEDAEIYQRQVNRGAMRLNDTL